MTDISEIRDIIRKRIPKIHIRVNEELVVDFRDLIEDKISVEQYIKKEGQQAPSYVGGRIGYAFERAFNKIFKGDKRFIKQDVPGHDFIFKSTPIEMKSSKMPDGFCGSDYSSKCLNYILIGYDLSEDVLSEESNMIEGLFVYVGPIKSKYWKINGSKKNRRAKLLIPNEEYDMMAKGVIYGNLNVRKNSIYLKYEREKINDKKGIKSDYRTKGIGVRNGVGQTRRSQNFHERILRRVF